MRCIGYYRGAREDLRALIAEAAESRGWELVCVLNDEEGEYASFRELQNLIKLETADAVLVPSVRHLGDDPFLRMENELFIRRNGVRLIQFKRPENDARHELLAAVSHFFSYDPEWSADYGSAMPLQSGPEYLRRDPPFGYRMEEGRAVMDEEDAEIVRRIFREAAEGRQISRICDGVNEMLAERDLRFGSSMVIGILLNQHYLGRMTKHRYVTEPIIRLDEWFMAHEAIRETADRDRRVFPFYPNVKSDRPVSYVANSFGLPGITRRNDNNLDVPAFETELCRVVKKYATEENASLLHRDYAVPYAKYTADAYPAAARAYNRAVSSFGRTLAELRAGDDSEEVQAELERLSVKKTFCGMRLRRINSERGLCTLGREEYLRFFKRASRMERLSLEEKAFIADAFIQTVVLKKGRAEAYVRDPSDGSLKAERLENVLLKN